MAVLAGGREIDCGDETEWGNPDLPPITSGRVAAMFAWGRRQLGERYILGADCTVPADARWAGLRTAIDTAHAYRRG